MSDQPSPAVKHVEGSFEVSFGGFAELPTEKGVTNHVVSPVFTCLGLQWMVYMYPGGFGSSGDGMVSVEVDNQSLLGVVQYVNFSCSIGVRDSSGRGLISHHDDAIESCVIYDFARRSTILGALTEGALVIEVRLKLTDPAGMPPRSFPIENPFCKNMQRLFLDEESADVVFEVDTRKDETNDKQTGKGDAKRQKLSPTLFHAHRCIIKEGAPMLFELCKSGGKIRLNDVKSDVLRDILFYLYGGELSDETLAKNAREFIDAADRYGAAHLKLRAEAEHVKAPISFDDAMDTLLYSDAKNCALLKEAVMDFLVEHKDEAIKKISFGDGNAPRYFMKDLLTAMAASDRKKETSWDDPNDYSTMRVDALRRRLHEKGLDIDGSREAMISLLENHS